MATFAHNQADTVKFYLASFNAETGDEIKERSGFIRNNWFAHFGPELGLKPYDVVKLVFTEEMENSPECRRKFAKKFTLYRHGAKGQLVEQFDVIPFMWGPFVKNGTVLAFRIDRQHTLDIVQQYLNMAKIFEALYRASNFFSPNASGSVVGTWDILALPIGTTFVDEMGLEHIISDGQGFTRFELVAGVEEHLDFSKWAISDESSTSFTVLQDLEWNEALAGELLPVMDEKLEVLSDDSWFEFKENRRLQDGTAQYSDVALRERILIKLQEKGVKAETLDFLKLNKFFTHTMSDAWARKAEDIATACGLPSQGGMVVGVPGAGRLAVIPQDGTTKYWTMDVAILWRYPISDPDSKQAVEVDQDSPMAMFLAQAEGMQYRLADKHFQHGLKGVSVFIDRDRLGDSLTVTYPDGRNETFDISNVMQLVALDDRKLGPSIFDKDAVQGVIYTVEDAILMLNHWIAPGNFVGLTLDLMKVLGADADGDLVFFADGNRFPEFFRQVENHRSLHFPKLTKTKTSMEKYAALVNEAAMVMFAAQAAGYAMDSMVNLVGKITNQLASWFALSPRQQDVVAKNRFGKTADEVVSQIMSDLQAAVDLFKVKIDSKQLRARVARIQKAFANPSPNAEDKAIGKVVAPWTKFKNSDVLFRKELPTVEAWGNMEGTVAHILNYALERNAAGEYVRFPEPPAIVPNPDIEYQVIVPEPAASLRTLASDVHQKYGFYAQSLNMSNDAEGNNREWETFCTTMNARIEGYLREYNKQAAAQRLPQFSKKDLVLALWWHIHSSERASNYKNSNTAPWVLGEDIMIEAWLNYDQNGAQSKHYSDDVINGLQYAFEQPEMRMQLNGRSLPVIVEKRVAKTKEGEQYRYFVVAAVKVPGLKTAQAEGYPANCLGVLSHKTKIEEGRHQVEFNRVPGKNRGESWSIKVMAA